MKAMTLGRSHDCGSGRRSQGPPYQNARKTTTVVGSTCRCKEVIVRRRLYWILPDTTSARRVADDMLLARVEERHLHFVARAGTDMSGLHPANVLQTSDLVRSAEVGLVLGCLSGGVLGTLFALFYPIVGDSTDWGLLGLFAIIGGLFGAWSSSMIGASVPSLRLRRFQPQIEAGQILLMVDVPRSRVAHVEARLQALHPEASPMGREPGIPAFP